MLLLLTLACHERPSASQTCADDPTPSDLSDDVLGFSGEEVFASLAAGRVAEWSATGEVITFTYAQDTGEVQRVDRTDGADGGCARTGTYLSLPVQVAVTADDVSAIWRGALRAWALADEDLDLALGAVDSLDVSSDVRDDVDEWADGSSQEITGFSAWLSGTVAAGSLVVEADVVWSDGDTGSEEEDTFTVLDGDWEVEAG